MNKEESIIRDQQTPLDRNRWEGCDICAGVDIEEFKTLEIKLQNVSVSAYDAIIELVISLGLYGDALIRPDRRCAKLYRSRWEGCGWCKQINPHHLRTRVWYCCECGRPLTEEAWAELERRINGGNDE